jgi:hypothetical protein
MVRRTHPTEDFSEQELGNEIKPHWFDRWRSYRPGPETSGEGDFLACDRDIVARSLPAIDFSRILLYSCIRKPIIWGTGVRHGQGGKIEA